MYADGDPVLSPEPSNDLQDDMDVTDTLDGLDSNLQESKRSAVRLGIARRSSHSHGVKDDPNEKVEGKLKKYTPALSVGAYRLNSLGDGQSDKSLLPFNRFHDEFTRLFRRTEGERAHAGVERSDTRGIPSVEFFVDRRRCSCAIVQIGVPVCGRGCAYKANGQCRLFARDSDVPTLEQGPFSGRPPSRELPGR